MLLFRAMVKEAKSKAARTGSRIIIGPWTHGSTSSRFGNIDFGSDAQMDREALQIRWFDHWLKGKPNGLDKEPPVRIFVMGDNAWRDEPHWPLRSTKDRILFLASNGHANTPIGGGKLVAEISGTDGQLLPQKTSKSARSSAAASAIGPRPEPSTPLDLIHPEILNSLRIESRG